MYTNSVHICVSLSKENIKIFSVWRQSLHYLLHLLALVWRMFPCSLHIYFLLISFLEVRTPSSGGCLNAIGKISELIFRVRDLEISIGDPLIIAWIRLGERRKFHKTSQSVVITRVEVEDLFRSSLICHFVP